MSKSRVAATTRKRAKLIVHENSDGEDKLPANERVVGKRRNVRAADACSFVEQVESGDAGGGHSELEQRRLKNIEANAKFLAELQLEEFKVKTNIRPPSKHSPSRTVRKNPWQASVRREPISLRSRTKSAGGDEPNATIVKVEVPDPINLLQYQRKPKGLLRLHDYWLNKDPDEQEIAVPTLPPSALVPVETDISHTAHHNNFSSLAADLAKMALTEDHVCKLVRSRICSLAVHPSQNELPIVAAADKEGQVGLWRVDSADGPLTFDIHSSAVYCLQFKATDPAHLYSCSYDGSLRCCHFETAVCQELYRSEEASETWLNFFDFETPHSILVAQSNGNILRVDERKGRGGGSGTAAELRLDAGALKTVHVHPQRRETFATASSTGLVQIWDSRRLGGSGRPHSVATLPSSRTVYSAFFSPVAGDKLVSTSADDTLKLYDTSTLNDVKLIRTISHNNHTGRWLTTFKATWHPCRDDVFVVGSMHYPRRIEIYNDKAEIVKLFYSDYLSSVCSINTFHPTMNVLVGGNSSGRVHVFMSP